MLGLQKRKTVYLKRLAKLTNSLNCFYHLTIVLKSVVAMLVCKTSIQSIFNTSSTQSLIFQHQKIRMYWFLTTLVMNMAHMLTRHYQYFLPVFRCFNTFALGLTFDLLLVGLLGPVEPRGTLSISNGCSAFSTNPTMTALINLQSVYADTHSHRGIIFPTGQVAATKFEARTQNRSKWVCVVLVGSSAVLIFRNERKGKAAVLCILQSEHNFTPWILPSLAPPSALWTLKNQPHLAGSTSRGFLS